MSRNTWPNDRERSLLLRTATDLIGSTIVLLLMMIVILGSIWIIQYLWRLIF